jgi:hypothetical protein
MSTDLEQIVAVHQGWYESNIGLDADAMLQYFPAGEGYHQFNLNGWTYSGVMYKHKLWMNGKAAGLNITMQKDVIGPDVQIFGDVAVVTAEGGIELVQPTSEAGLTSPTPMGFRITEFLRKDDGQGNPVWKVWHMHVSGTDKSMPKYGPE